MLKDKKQFFQISLKYPKENEEPINLSPYVFKLVVFNNINLVYQNFSIFLNINEYFLTKHKIYGQETLILKIQLTKDDINQVYEEYEYRLIIKSININVSKRDESELDKQNPMEQTLVFECVPLQPYQISSLPVNFLVSEYKNNMQTPLEISAYSIVKNVYDPNYKITNQQKEINREYYSWQKIESNTIWELFEHGFEKHVYGSPYCIPSVTFSGNNVNPHKQTDYLIPPMSLASSIDYLDDQYGIYRGPLYFGFLYDTYWYNGGEMRGNYIKLWDINSIPETNSDYVVHLLDFNKDNQQKILEITGNAAQVRPAEFYTYDPINLNYDGNRRTMEVGFNHISISKPDDNLYQKNSFDLTDLWKKNTFNYREEDVDIEINKDAFKRRTNVYTNYTGYGFDEKEKNIEWEMINRKNELRKRYSDNIDKYYEELNKLKEYRDEIYEKEFSSGPTHQIYHRSRISRMFSGMSTLTFVLHRNLHFLTLCRVGGKIRLKPWGEAFLPYGGYYIVKESTIEFNRESNIVFTCMAKVSCFRSNLSQKETSFQLYGK